MNAREPLIQLRQVLATRLSESELRDLCFDLGIDYADLPSGGKADKARDLLAHLERLDCISELLETAQRLRPDVDWSQIHLDDRMDALRTRRDEADRARREVRERQRVVNLRPLDVTHTFRDRVREMEELCQHLADSSVRLVSVVGRGGMGKSALVSRVLADLEQGVLLVPNKDRKLAIDGILYLGARSTGLSLERIYIDVGRMLGEPVASRLAGRWASEVPLTAKVEYLLEMMQDGLYLILLDNLEDVLTEDGTIAEESLRLFVERCLTQPGGAQLVATSREQVKVAAVALRGVRSIPLREGLPEDEAIALLRDLDPQGELGLRDAPEDELQRAAQLTQSIPRALEILAGILHEDPTANLTDLMDDEQLFGKQVVEQLVAKGYRRLGDDERQVMEALAVFDRPVEETAIAYLLYPWFPGLDVRARLRRLARSYFVSVNRVTSEYSLHPLDREYAYSQLPDDGGPSDYTRRNLELRAADFYASIRKPESEWKSIDDLAPQLAEFDHRVRAKDHDGACRVLEPIDSDCLYLWGHYARLVEMREGLLRRLIDPHLQAYNLGRLGCTHHILGQFDQAVNLFKQALTIVCEIGDRQGEAIWLGNLGITYRALGQFEQAIRLYEQSLVIAREIGDRAAEAHYLGRLGWVYLNTGQLKRAGELCEQALVIVREIGDRREEGYQFGRLGAIYLGLGWTEQAINSLEQALVIAREISDRRYEGVWLGYLGRASRSLGQIEKAIEFHEQDLVIAREIGNSRGEGIALGNLGIAYSALGQIERAVEFHQQALTIAREIGDTQHEGHWLSNLGLTCYRIGQVKQSVRLHKRALATARKIGYHRIESYCLLGLGRALLALGKLAEVKQCCVEARDLNVPETGHQAMSILGIALLHQQDSAAEGAFVGAAIDCRVMLDETPRLYELRYALAAATVGQAVCDPRWTHMDKHSELLIPALAEYQRALENCSAKGVVQDAIRDLELIRAAGIEGLEPVFELLESALA